MASPVLGIDLGTTNSVVAYADQHRVRVLRDENGNLLTSSTVSFHPSGQILIGGPARDRRLVDAQNTIFSVKRLIGRPFRSPEVRRAAERLPFKLEEGATGGVMVHARGEKYSLPEISSFVLRELRRIAEQALGQSCVNAVVTVPANFNELQRMATRDAGRIAGLNVLRILNEPTAAALAYGYRANTSQRIAVYDLGGGTFDISILELSGDVIEVVATAGDTYLGGDDIDGLIAERMAAEFLARHKIDVTRDVQAFERVRLAGEWIKCQLSVLESAEATVQEVAYGSGGESLDLVFRLTRSELDQMIFKLIGRTFDICEDAMRLAGVRPTQLDGVILVGGQTRTPKVRDMVGEYFGMAPQSSVDPDLVVGQGAALQGFALAGARPDTRRTLSGSVAPPARGSEPLRNSPSQAPVSPFAQSFEDQPTTIANRIAERPPSMPFDDLPTTIADRVDDDNTAPDALASSKATLSGLGSKVPMAPAQPSTNLPKPPPLSQVLDSARRGASTAPVPVAIGSIVKSAEALGQRAPGRTLAETPGAKQGKRPSQQPASASTATPLSTVPKAPKLPSDLAAFPSADEGDTIEEEIPAALLFQTPAPAAHAPAVPPPTAAKGSLPAPAPIKPPIATLAETPRAKAAQRASQLPPAPPSTAATAKPSVAPPKPVPAPSVVPAKPAGVPSVAPAAAPKVITELPYDPPPAARSIAPSAGEEPIRTQSMARLLAQQGHVERALAIYDELIKKAPKDAALLAEAAALRTPKPVAQPLQLFTPKPAGPPPSAAPAPEPRSSSLPPAKTGASQSGFPAPARTGQPLLLLDVTPHTLAVETAGGYCEQIIERNAPIPTEQTRVFSTSQDNQSVVSIRVCQGEARRTEENQVLGQLELVELRAGRRGEVSIAVTFIIDADGTLHVKAQDKGTGRAQGLRVNLLGAIDEKDIERSRSRTGKAGKK